MIDVPTFKPTLAQRARLLFSQDYAVAFSAAVPVLAYYGGATVTRARDANKRLFTVCCAKNLQINAFGLYSLQDGIAQQIAPLVSGRGSIWIDLTDGTANWVGWDGNAPPQGGPIPGFAPLSLGGQPGPPGPAGAGGVVLFDAPLSSSAWDARQLASGAGAWIDVPTVFNAPVASVYLLRLVALSAAPNVRVRAGSQAAPYMLTVNTQREGIEIHAQGWACGPALWISAVGGAASVTIQIVGHG